MSEKKDPYQVLGVDRSASTREIKSAYRRLARKYHPDHNPGDNAAEDSFKEVAEAWEILGDEEKRAQFDRFGHAAFAGGGAAPGPDIFSVFGSIFGDFMGQGRRQRGPVRGEDAAVSLKVPFEVAIHGGKREIRYTRIVHCDSCDGSGAGEGGTWTTCPTCQGHGEVRTQQGIFVMQSTCKRCHGRGEVVTVPCQTCSGLGMKREEATHEIEIPAGVDTGVRLRVQGAGHAGERGAEHGDLYVVFEVEPSLDFERHDLDLVLTLPLDFVQAALGAEVEVPTIEGCRKVKIKAGSQHGQTTTLGGLGLPSLRRRGVRGDMIVRYAIEVPTKLSSRERELLEELARERKVETKSGGLLDRLKRLFSASDATESGDAE